MQRKIHLHQRCTHMLVAVQTTDTQRALNLRGALIGQKHIAVIIINGEVALLPQPPDYLRDFPTRGTAWLITGQNKRNQRLIHQHRIRLVHNRHIRAVLHCILAVSDQLVPQHVKTNLIHRAIHNVSGIGFTTLARIQLLGDTRHRQPKKLHQRAHPLRVALRQIVIHRDRMHAFTHQAKPSGRHRAHQRLALTSGHVNHIALKQTQRRL